MSKNKITKELFRKYLDGQCTEEEKKEVLQYLLDPENEERAASLMEETWSEMPQMLHSLPSSSSEHRYDKIRAKIKPQRQILTPLYKIAASLLLLVTFTTLIYRNWETIVLTVAPIQYVTYTTQTGERMQVQLPDGSKVWLNASSVLKFPERFRGKTRELELQGEAFFQVKRDESKPFIVRTGEFYTQVLGTSFDLKAYHGDNRISVTVATGKVAVGLWDSVTSRSNELAQLTPNEQVVYSMSAKKVLQHTVEAGYTAAWKDGKLVFTQTALKDVISTLERWYGVQIETEIPEHSTCTFTAHFGERTPLTDILESIRITGKIEYTITGHKIKIKAKPCIQ